MEVAGGFDPGDSGMERRRSIAPDVGLFAGFKYKITMFLTQIKWQQVNSGCRAVVLERGRLLFLASFRHARTLLTCSPSYVFCAGTRGRAEEAAGGRVRGEESSPL